MTKATYAQKYANLYKLASSNPSKPQNALIKIAQEKGYGFRKSEMRQLIREVKAGKSIKESKFSNEKLKHTVQTKRKVPSKFKLLRELMGSDEVYVRRYATKNYVVEFPNDDDSWIETAEKCYKGYNSLVRRRGKVKGKRSYRKFVLNALAKLKGEETVISSVSFTDVFKVSFDEIYDTWIENLQKIAQSLEEDPEVLHFWVGFTEYEDRKD